MLQAFSSKESDPMSDPVTLEVFSDYV